MADRLREVFLDGKWVANTNYKEQLNSLTWSQATHRMGKFNTIAVLVFHMNYYFVGLLQAFKNGRLEIRDSYSFDMPEISSEIEWEHLKNEFLANAKAFSQLVESFDDETLKGPFVDEKYGTNHRNIEAVIEHGYYHLGQISLIRKMMLEEGIK